MYAGEEVNVEEQLRRYERPEEFKPEGKVQKLAVFTVDGGEEYRAGLGMTPINPSYPPKADVLQARRARAKTCGSNRVLEGDLLGEETCGAERMKQEVLVMGIEAPGCPQEDTGT